MNPSPTPAAEVAINSALVRSLLETQHPDLSGLLLEEVTAGFDNAVFRLGPKLAVRLPRRFAAAALLEHEQKWLPLIANHLPVPVPSTLRIGRPDRGYPWCWSILPWLKGEAADLASLKPDQAKPLARFLRALHVEAPADAPKNKLRGVPLRQRAAAIEDRMQRLEQKTKFVTADIRKIWQSGVQAAEDERPTWIHGDLHARNILVEDGSISGVIDWGDMASGDRATDLAAIWMLLPSLGSRERAMSEYGAVPRATWLRARGWATLFGLLLLDNGLADNPRHAKMGELTLRRIAEGPY
jgi:aminoglycoside phosphotransferase (APT) family kinase protein